MGCRSFFKERTIRAAIWICFPWLIYHSNKTCSWCQREHKKEEFLDLIYLIVIRTKLACFSHEALCWLIQCMHFFCWDCNLFFVKFCHIPKRPSNRTLWFTIGFKNKTGLSYMPGSIHGLWKTYATLTRLHILIPFPFAWSPRGNLSFKNWNSILVSSTDLRCFWDLVFWDFSLKNTRRWSANVVPALHWCCSELGSVSLPAALFTQEKRE